MLVIQGPFGTVFAMNLLHLMEDGANYVSGTQGQQGLYYVSQGGYVFTPVCFLALDFWA